MNEEKILNQALELYIDGKVEQAYTYLMDEKDKLNSLSGQYYNFLYCIAAVINKPEDALNHLEEAVLENNMWYRPEVFEDEDLDSIRMDDRFKLCQARSDELYEEALKTSQTICTWNEKTSNHLFLALHGNQQNMEDAKEYWSFISHLDYQVEYLQSKELDSIGTFRWDNDGDGFKELHQTMQSITFNDYDKQILCGFSAGCNVILKTLLEYDTRCDAILLQSPWIPMIETQLDQIVETLKNRGIKVFIVCGTDDEDCYPLATRLKDALDEKDVFVRHRWNQDLSHELSTDHQALITGFIKEI